METPLSTRRITRSQSKAAALSSRKVEESRKFSSKKDEKTERTRLIDIVNGSPIVGLATSKLMNKTPINNNNKSSRCNKTPSSGEALLRGQVHNLLLNKVDQISKFLSFDTVSGLNNQFDSLASVSESPVEEKGSSVMPMKDEEDEDGSMWSVQVNVSTRDEEEEVEQAIKEEELVREDKELDEVCEGLKNVSVNDEKTVFVGKHIRFVYDSDDELVEEEEELQKETASS